MAKTGARPNDPCPCGSGKKYKNCHPGKYTNKHYVYFGFKDKNDLSKPAVVFSNTEQERMSPKPKIVSSVYGSPEFHSPDFLKKEFDEIVAIDTNTKKIDGEFISVSAIVQCLPRWNFMCKQNVFILFKGVDGGEAEKVAIAYLISRTARSKGYRSDKRFGIVTDHNLGKHAQYNDRQLPIHGDFYLPKNFRLLYATKNAGKADILSSLINRCDAKANIIKKQMQKNKCAIIGDNTVHLSDIPDFSSL